MIVHICHQNSTKDYEVCTLLLSVYQTIQAIFVYLRHIV